MEEDRDLQTYYVKTTAGELMTIEAHDHGFDEEAGHLSFFLLDEDEDGEEKEYTVALFHAGSWAYVLSQAAYEENTVDAK